MPNETIQLIFQIKAEGQATLAALKQVISGTNAELEKGTKIVASLKKSNDELTVSLKSVSSAEEQADGARRKNNEGLTASIVKAAFYTEALNRMFSAIREVTVESALYAARTQQLNVVMDQLARSNGLSVLSVRAQADAVKALGITTQESRATISNMIFAQLDLTKATNLARIAQDAAKIAGINSSDALAGIINGIKTQQIEVLRTYGIQVNLEQAFIRGAAAMHKSRETLTDYERTNIALNEVLSKGPRILGTYEVSLTTAGGQMQSMKRYIDEAKNALGEGFIPILQKVVGLLTDATKSVQENSEAYQGLAKHITAAALAATAARFTPGGPIAKIAVGAAVAVGVEEFANIDRVAQQVDFARSAIEKIEADRKSLIKQFNSGRIKDKEEFLKEDERLKEIEIQIEENLTETLALEFKKRRKNSSTSKLQFFEEAIRFITVPHPEEKNSTRPTNLDLGSGRKVSADQIETAIGNSDKEIPFDAAGLTARKDPAAAIDALLGQYSQRIKQATKAAQGELDRAGQSLLSGESKIQANRRDSLNKLAEEFKSFNDAFGKTLKDAAEIKDPKEREDLIKTVNTVKADYFGVAARINRQFDLELDKFRREAITDQIQRDKKIAEAQADVKIQSARQGIQQSEQLRKAKTQPGDDDRNIISSYNERIQLAQEEFKVAQQRAIADFEAAKELFNFDKNVKTFKDAEANKRVADIKSEGQFIKEKSDIEVDKQAQILELRRKQKAEITAAYENAKRIADTEVDLSNQAIKNDSERRVKLVQARSLPGNEVYVQNQILQQRIASAKIEFDQTRKRIEEDKAAALENYVRTKDRIELERSATDIRTRELKSAAELEKNIADARVDREIQIAELRKRQTEELRSSLSSLYDALKANGRGGFRDFLQGYVDQIKKTLFVNIGEELFRGASQRLGGIIPGQEKIDPVTGKGTGELTQLGRILRGTPLGIDPVKLAQERQVNSQNRNTKALQDLTDALSGTNGSIIGASGGSTASGGGLRGILGTILGGGSGSDNPLIIKNFSNGFLAGNNPQTSIDFRPDRGLGSLSSSIGGFFGPKTNAQGKPTFSAGQTGLAIAGALPQIIGGIQQGGAAGALGAVSGALGAAASIPGPQQPFILGAAIFTNLLGGLLGKDKVKEKQELLANRLDQKFTQPNSIDRVEDLAGNSVDYDFRGKLRTFNSQPSTNINVHVSTMDSKSFMDHGAMIAEATRAQFQLGHPLQSTIKESVGIS